MKKGTATWRVAGEKKATNKEEQIKQIHMEFPYKLVVKKTGEADPTKETFKFVIEDFGAPVDYKIISDAIETNGERKKKKFLRGEKII